ncbi:MAG: hypothetical protein V7K38_10915 [Nostoc sp.]|uniref:hypothetical protein n=1 Tax=Nostoc sp. TaxID=1180 RepID=UPI002FFBFD33
MGITVLVSLVDATRNFLPNTYSVILYKILVLQGFYFYCAVKPPVTMAKPSRLMIGVASLQKIPTTTLQMTKAIAPILTTIYDWDNFKETW